MIGDVLELLIANRTNASLFSFHCASSLIPAGVTV